MTKYRVRVVNRGAAVRRPTGVLHASEADVAAVAAAGAAHGHLRLAPEGGGAAAAVAQTMKKRVAFVVFAVLSCLAGTGRCAGRPSSSAQFVGK